MNNQEQNNDNLSVFNSLPGDKKIVKDQQQVINSTEQSIQSNQKIQFVDSVPENNLQINMSNGAQFNGKDSLMQPMGNMNSSTVDNVSKYNSAFNQKVYSDEELLRSFVGNNFDKVVTKRFNFSSLIFGPFYFL